MENSKVKALITIVVAIISILTISSLIISGYEDKCQKDVLFIQANNTEFFYRASTFSNAHIMAGFFADYFNKSKDNVAALGDTFNSLQEQTRDYRRQISDKITSCYNYSLLNKYILVSALLLSLINLSNLNSTSFLISGYHLMNCNNN